MNPNRILIIQTAFIGDVILATALLESLHRQFEGVRLDILVRKGNEGLFENHPYIHEVLVWDKKSGKYKSLFGLLKKIRKSRYDLLVNLQRYATTGLLTLLSGAGIRVGFDKNPLSFGFDRKIPHKFEEGVHETVRNHRLIESMTASDVAKPRLYPSDSDYGHITQYQQYPYICLAPASVWYTKQYPPDGWIQLIRNLPGHYTMLITGGKGDGDLAEAIRDALDEKEKARTINVCGKLSLLQSAALMQGAVMNYVNDSAPMHLCSAVNAPVCAVYCSTVPEFGYGPLSDRSFIVETDEKLSCRPCGLHGHKVCPEAHFKCAYGIRTDQLTEVISQG